MINDVWESVDCPFCPPGQQSDYLTVGDRFKSDDDSKLYQLSRCCECGLIYLNPRPTQDKIKSAHEADEYDPFLSFKKNKGLKDQLYEFSRKIALKWKHRLVSQIVPPNSSIVDGGCGTGEFLNELKGDYTLYGFEPDPRAAAFARERFGLDVFTGYFDALDVTAETIDLFTLWHVLEHIDKPVDVLRRISSILSEKGRIILGLPNIRSLDSIIYKEYWVPLDAPRHLWHFSPAQISILARETGFRIIRQGAMPLDPFYNVLLSELYFAEKTSKLQYMLFPFRFPFLAIGSMLYGTVSGNHSSVYYVLEKN